MIISSQPNSTRKYEIRTMYLGFYMFSEGPHTLNGYYGNAFRKWISFTKSTWNQWSFDVFVAFFHDGNKMAPQSFSSHFEMGAQCGIKNATLQLHSHNFGLPKYQVINCIWQWWSHNVDVETHRNFFRYEQQTFIAFNAMDALNVWDSVTEASFAPHLWIA